MTDAGTNGSWSLLSTAVISDVLDSLGYPDQVFSLGFSATYLGRCFFGQARTGECAAISGDIGGDIDGDIDDNASPYARVVAFMDDLKAGEVVVWNCKEPVAYSAWGELLSAACLGRGVAGAVIDGYIRDEAKIKVLGFPVLHRGTSSVSALGRADLVAADKTIQCAGVNVAPGDWVFCDPEGGVVIPDAAKDQTLEIGLQNTVKESEGRARLIDGASLREVLDEFEVI